MSIHGLWFGDEWTGEWFGADDALPPQNGYFGHRYFAIPFYGPRYFAPYGETTLTPPSTGQNGYFGHRYFAIPFYGPRYFSPYGETTLVQESDGVFSGGAFHFRIPHPGLFDTSSRTDAHNDVLLAVVAAWLTLRR